MPRFYFDLLFGGELLPDDVGAEAKDLGEAEREAILNLAEVACMRDAQPTDPNLAIQIRNHRGQVCSTTGIKISVDRVSALR